MLEAVIAPGIEMEFHFYTGLCQPGDILNRLIAERVQLSDASIGGRQPRQMLRTAGRSIRR